MGSLYAVGSFFKVGGLDAQNIARYDVAAKRWLALSSPDRVKAMVSQGNDLYFVGAFDVAGSSSGVGGVVRFNGSDQGEVLWRRLDSFLAWGDHVYRQFWCGFDACGE